MTRDGNKLSPKNPLALLLYSSSVMAGGAVWSFYSDSTGAPAAVVALTSFLAPLVSIAGNLLPDVLKTRFIHRFTRDDVLRNGELGHAVGEAVCAALHEAAKGAKLEDDRLALARISRNPEEVWEAIARSAGGQDASAVVLTEEELEGVSPEGLTDYFSVRARDFDELRALTPQVWVKIILRLCEAFGQTLWDKEIERIADLLHRRFPHYLKRALVSNPSGDWKAFVSLQTQLFAEVIAGVKEIEALDRELGVKLDEHFVEVNGVLLTILTEIREGRGDEQRGEASRQARRVNDELRELLARHERQLLVYTFKERVYGALKKALDGDTSSTFFRKYISKGVYLPRKEVQEQFDSFMGQSARRCFAVVGNSGNGKTCLLCWLAESLAEPGSGSLPLLVSADELALTHGHADELVLFILDRLRFEHDRAGGRTGLAALGEFLKLNGLQLVVFIDALNELQGRDSAEVFNAQLDHLLRQVAEHDYPLRVVATCRLESWQQFNLSQWARDHVYRGAGLDQQASCPLETLSEREVEQLAEIYFDFYAIEGKLTDEAKETCRSPLMLRFLCDAYTNRDPDDKKTRAKEIEKVRLNEIASFRRKEILKKYVATRRAAFVEFTRQALQRGADSSPGPVTPSKVYALTTLYILHLANFMYESRRASITADEVCRVAEQLGHPDARLGPAGIAADASSFFLQLVDYGIFSRNAGRDTFSFVYETYFEFSLGRYIAFVRWKQKAGAALDISKIIEDMEALIAEHGRASQKDNFSNLFGALHFAVLATETGPWIDADADETPVEERIYYDYPELFIRLVGALADTRKRFDWIQQACLIIQEAELSKRETWKRLRDRPDSRQLAERYFGQLLSVLDDLTKSTDFVVLWDLGNTLEALAAANFEHTLSHITHWALSDEKLQPIFATQIVSKLAPHRPERVIKVLSEWVTKQAFRSNFWLMRSLLFAVSEIARSGHQADLDDNAHWVELRDEIFKLASATESPGVSPYIRGRALSLLPLLSGLHPAELGRMRRSISEVSRAEDSWQLWSLAYELQHVPDSFLAAPNDWLWETLAQISDAPNQHVRYAVENTVRELGDRRRAAPEGDGFRAALAERLKGARWRATLRPRLMSYPHPERVAVVYSPAYMEPDYENHVECRERLHAIVNRLEECGEEKFTWVLPEAAYEEDLLRAHSKDYDRHRDGSRWFEYVETVKAASERLAATRGRGSRVGPSELRFESYDIARLAAGGVIQAVEYVQSFPAPAAFVLNRPPGHLANNTICIFNNIAIGAKYAMERFGFDRILIVDCDAHHGKHTQQVFYNSPRVLYFSTHIDGDYARETGQVPNTGDGEGDGYTFNIPYPARMGEEGYRHIVDELLIPVALDFRPQLIMVSAGFDAHFDDPLTPQCLLPDESFVYLARRLKEIAAPGGVKIVAALEGGYGLAGMSNSLARMLDVWGDWGMGETLRPTPRPPGYDEEVSAKAAEDVREIVRARLKLMRDRKEADGGYFFDPEAAHWGRATS